MTGNVWCISLPATSRPSAEQEAYLQSLVQAINDSSTVCTAS